MYAKTSTHKIRQRQSGVTMVELVMSIAIISIAVLGLMLVIAGTSGRSSDALVELQAAAIAEAYLEEAMQASFCDPNNLGTGQTCRTFCTARACTTGGCGAADVGGRANFDDVCDYGSINDSGARDRSGALLGGLGAYNVTMNVVDSGFTFGTPALDPDLGEVVRIDIRVSHQALPSDFALSAFRANAQ